MEPKVTQEVLSSTQMLVYHKAGNNVGLEGDVPFGLCNIVGLRGGEKPSASSRPVELRGQALLELILKDWGGSPAPTLMPESLRKRVQLRGSPDPWGRVQIASTSWVAHLAIRVSLTQKL